MTRQQQESYRRDAEEAARRQRAIQQEVEQLETARGEHAGTSGAIQAGPHPHPENPLPRQHLNKPGLESQLYPRPEYLAPEYRGSGKLEGMVALITGGDSGIGRSVAVLYAREGANVAIVYLDEEDDAAT